MLGNGNALDQKYWQGHIDVVGKHELDAQGFLFLVKTKRAHRIFVIWTCRPRNGLGKCFYQRFDDVTATAYIYRIRKPCLSSCNNSAVYLIWTTITARPFVSILQVTAYLMMSALSAAIPITNRMREGADNVFTDSSAASISMAFFAFVCLALSALISGFKLAKQTYIWSEAPYTDTCVYIVVLHMFVCSVVYSLNCVRHLPLVSLYIQVWFIVTV